MSGSILTEGSVVRETVQVSFVAGGYVTAPPGYRLCPPRREGDRWVFDIEPLEVSVANEGLPIAGYREQPDWAVDLVNKNKRMEETLLGVLDKLAGVEEFDKRWLALGRTHIEQGFMAINRAIWRPSRLSD